MINIIISRKEIYYYKLIRININETQQIPYFYNFIHCSYINKKSKVDLDNDLSIDDNVSYNKPSVSKYKRISNSMSLKDKQDRLKTCSNVVQNFASKNYDKIIELAGFIDPNSESDSSVKHAMSLFLMSCYKNLPIENNLLEGKSIDESFNKYLEFDSWYDVYMSSQKKS